MDPKDTENSNEPAPFPEGQAPFDPFPPRGREMAPEPAAEAADDRNDWIEAADPHDLPTREPRLIALGRYAFPPEPPLDEEGEAARDRRWASRAVMAAAALLLVFNSVSIQSWASRQEPGWIASTVQQLADVWTTQISLLGADQLRRGLREAYEDAAATRFPGQAEAPPT